VLQTSTSIILFSQNALKISSFNTWAGRLTRALHQFHAVILYTAILHSAACLTLAGMDKRSRERHDCSSHKTPGSTEQALSCHSEFK